MHAFSFFRSSPTATHIAPHSLLFDDADDALVPLAPSNPSELDSQPESLDGEVRLRHPAHANPEVLQRAVDWVGDPRASWGVRRTLLTLSGINLGPSRRERELRLMFCALYQASYESMDAIR